MQEKLVSISCQLWESQFPQIDKVVELKTEISNGRIKTSRSSVLRDAFDFYVASKFPQLLKK